MDPNSLSTLSNSPWWNVLLIVLGALCATVGSSVAAILTAMYQAKKARQVKMEETIGRQKVEVYKKALRLAGQLQSILIQGIYDDTIAFIAKENPWVLENEILLPPKFAQYWHSLRSNLRTAKREEKAQGKMPDGKQRNQKIEAMEERDTFMDELAKEAEKEIRNELGLPPVKILRPPKSNLG